MNLLKVGANWLKGTLQENAGETVQYVRRPASTEGELRQPEEFEATAVVGQTEFTLETDETISGTWISQDFIFSIEAFHQTRTGEQGQPIDFVPPRGGDEIRRVVGEFVEWFKVLTPGDEPEWRFTNKQQNALRVHTKLIRREYNVARKTEL